MADAVIVFKPAAPLTHREMLIDFVDLPPQTEFSVNISGPLAQPYWATLRTDGTGYAQLFWRTQAPGEYTVAAKGEGVSVSSGFSVSPQEGEAAATPVAAVKTVEETPAPEPAKPKSAPKPAARRKRTTGQKAR